MPQDSKALTSSCPQVNHHEPDDVHHEDIDDEEDHLSDEDWLRIQRFGKDWAERDAVRASVLSDDNSIECVVYRLIEVDGNFQSIELGEGKALLHHQIDFPGKTAFDSLFTYQLEFDEESKKDTRLKRDDFVHLLLGYNCILGFVVEDFQLGEFGTLCDLWRDRACDSIPGVTDPPPKES